MIELLFIWVNVKWVLAKAVYEPFFGKYELSGNFVLGGGFHVLNAFSQLILTIILWN